MEALLGSGRVKPFVTPEYQRPYAWTDEHAETLFENLLGFTAASRETKREGSYFLVISLHMKIKMVSKK